MIQVNYTMNLQYMKSSCLISMNTIHLNGQLHEKPQGGPIG